MVCVLYSLTVHVVKIIGCITCILLRIMEQDFTKKRTVQEAPRIVTERVIDRIKQKLTAVEVSESEQIDRLVELATLHENLCQCYIGWCPFW
uniref:FATC domain-containing protein n=1 Tax=Heterorhabditis bacteriophora TaxID=37862 RepID=A0A1I7WNI1_HETBA